MLTAPPTRCAPCCPRLGSAGSTARSWDGHGAVIRCLPPHPQAQERAEAAEAEDAVRAAEVGTCTPFAASLPPLPRPASLARFPRALLRPGVHCQRRHTSGGCGHAGRSPTSAAQLAASDPIRRARWPNSATTRCAAARRRRRRRARRRSARAARRRRRRWRRRRRATRARTRRRAPQSCARLALATSHASALRGRAARLRHRVARPQRDLPQSPRRAQEVAERLAELERARASAEEERDAAAAQLGSARVGRAGLQPVAVVAEARGSSPALLLTWTCPGFGLGAGGAAHGGAARGVGGAAQLGARSSICSEAARSLSSR